LTHSEGDPREWSTVLVTALGSWGQPVPYGHYQALLSPRPLRVNPRPLRVNPRAVRINPPPLHVNPSKLVRFSSGPLARHPHPPLPGTRELRWAVNWRQGGGGGTQGRKKRPRWSGSSDSRLPASTNRVSLRFDLESETFRVRRT
jgi:hypothetical protein